MNLETLNTMVQPLTVIGCLIFGYVLKNYIPTDNKHIPLILVIGGILMSVALDGFVSIETTVLGGALSGLVSTGLHQLFHQYIKGSDKELTYNELNKGE